jgi:hypothetical protein
VSFVRTADRVQADADRGDCAQVLPPRGSLLQYVPSASRSIEIRIVASFLFVSSTDVAAAILEQLIVEGRLGGIVQAGLLFKYIQRCQKHYRFRNICFNFQRRIVVIVRVRRVEYSNNDAVAGEKGAVELCASHILTGPSDAHQELLYPEQLHRYRLHVFFSPRIQKYDSGYGSFFLLKREYI